LSAGNFKSRNLLSEHNWRKKLHESLDSLQSVVPNISKVRYEFQLQTIHYDIGIAMPQIWVWLFCSTMNRAWDERELVAPRIFTFFGFQGD
jgi:hypothetical protein